MGESGDIVSDIDRVDETVDDAKNIMVGSSIFGEINGIIVLM